MNWLFLVNYIVLSIFCYVHSQVLSWTSFVLFIHRFKECEIDIFFADMMTLGVVAVDRAHKSLSDVGDTEVHKHGDFANNGRAWSNRYPFSPASYHSEMLAKWEAFQRFRHSKSTNKKLRASAWLTKFLRTSNVLKWRVSAAPSPAILSNFHLETLLILLFLGRDVSTMMSQWLHSNEKSPN